MKLRRHIQARFHFGLESRTQMSLIFSTTEFRVRPEAAISTSLMANDCCNPGTSRCQSQTLAACKENPATRARKEMMMKARIYEIVCAQTSVCGLSETRLNVRSIDGPMSGQFLTPRKRHYRLSETGSGSVFQAVPIPFSMLSTCRFCSLVDHINARRKF